MLYDRDPDLTFDLLNMAENLFSLKPFQLQHALSDFNQIWSEALYGKWLQKLSDDFGVKGH